MKNIILIVILITFVTGGSVFSQSTPQQFFNNGLEAYYDARFDDGINFFTTYIKSMPNDPKGYNYRGLCYQSKKDYPRAIENFTNSISVAPNFSDGYLNRGNTFTLKMDFPSAMDDYYDVIRLNPDAIEAYFGKARAYIAQRKYNEALREVNSAQGIAPMDARVYVNYVWVYFYLQDTSQMFENITTAIYYDSNIVFTDFRRDLLFLKVETYKGALNGANQNIAKFPESYLAYFTRGVIYFLMNNFPLATEDLETSVKLNKNANKDPKFKKAIEEIMRCIRLNS